MRKFIKFLKIFFIKNKFNSKFFYLIDSIEKLDLYCKINLKDNNKYVHNKPCLFKS